MDLEPPVLLPPDDLPLPDAADGNQLTVARCQLVAHNVAPDGKANPVDEDDQHFIYVYQFGPQFYRVRGLNPEMMSGEEISAAEADRLLALLPYRTA